MLYENTNHTFSSSFTTFLCTIQVYNPPCTTNLSTNGITIDQVPFRKSCPRMISKPFNYDILKFAWPFHSYNSMWISYATLYVSLSLEFTTLIKALYVLTLNIGSPTISLKKLWEALKSTNICTILLFTIKSTWKTLFRLYPWLSNKVTILYKRCSKVVFSLCSNT